MSSWIAELMQPTSPLAMSGRFEVWTRSPISVAKSGLRASAFFKSPSDRTPPFAAIGESSAISRLRASKPCRASRVAEGLFLKGLFLKGLFLKGLFLKGLVLKGLVLISGSHIGERSFACMKGRFIVRRPHLCNTDPILFPSCAILRQAATLMDRRQHIMPLFGQAQTRGE